FLRCNPYREPAQKRVDLFERHYEDVFAVESRFRYRVDRSGAADYFSILPSDTGVGRQGLLGAADVHERRDSTSTRDVPVPMLHNTEKCRFHPGLANSFN